MRSLIDPDQLLDQGDADRYASWFAEQLNPARHLDNYLRDVAVAFELGGDDHIPADNAWDFRSALLDQDLTARNRIRVTVHDGLDHFGVTAAVGALQAAVNLLTTPEHSAG